MSNMDISEGTCLPKLAYICDYDDCGKLFVIRVEEFYLRKECQNCYNMFIKSENRHKTGKGWKHFELFLQVSVMWLSNQNVCAGKLIIPRSWIIFCYMYSLHTLLFY